MVCISTYSNLKWVNNNKPVVLHEQLLPAKYVFSLEACDKLQNIHYYRAHACTSSHFYLNVFVKREAAETGLGLGWLYERYEYSYYERVLIHEIYEKRSERPRFRGEWGS